MSTLFFPFTVYYLRSSRARYDRGLGTLVLATGTHYASTKARRCYRPDAMSLLGSGRLLEGG